MMYIFGSLIGTVGLFMIFICGGGETFLDCILCGGLGASAMLLGSLLMNLSDAMDAKKKNKKTEKKK